MTYLILAALIALQAVVVYFYTRALARMHEAQAATLQALARSQEALARMQAVLDRTRRLAENSTQWSDSSDSTVMFARPHGDYGRDRYE